MAQNIHRAVSSRGQWRDTFIAISYAGPFDLGEAVIRFEVEPADADRCGALDYGHWVSGAARAPLLSASTDDDTGRISAAVAGGDLAITWLFPTQDMRRLCRGAYVARLFAILGDEEAEIERLSFVVN